MRGRAIENRKRLFSRIRKLAYRQVDQSQFRSDLKIVGKEIRFDGDECVEGGASTFRARVTLRAALPGQEERRSRTADQSAPRLSTERGTTRREPAARGQESRPH